MITWQNFLNRLPCRGFVRNCRSFYACNLGQCWIMMPLPLILSFIQKYLVLIICSWDLSPADMLRPFFSSLTALSLSFQNILIYYIPFLFPQEVLDPDKFGFVELVFMFRWWCVNPSCFKNVPPRHRRQRCILGPWTLGCTEVPVWD